MKNLAPIFCLSVFFFGCSKSGSNSNNGSSYSHDKNVGASSNDLLSNSKYSSIKIEIQYSAGFEPDAAAIDHLVNFLNTRLNKPGGIVVEKKLIPVTATMSSAQDVINIEKQYRTVFTTGNQLGVYLLVTGGNYTTANVLGIAYRNTSMCLFGKTIHDNSGAIGQASRTKLEATVLEHEFGHILGLVDIGTAMQTNHKDAAHDAHCNNSNCLMYYAAETTDVLGFLITGNIPSLDANCVNDLNANGGK